MPAVLSLPAVLGAGAVLFASFDVFWFLRLAYTRLSALLAPKLDMKDTSVLYSVCTTNDVDYFCHMNNSRYVREMDFGRFDFYFRTGLARYLRQHPKVFVVQHASMIRYRRSLDFLMPYRLHTRLIWFDERSLYFEQRFVSVRDDFVRAVALCKNTAVNCDVPAMMRDNFGVSCREDVFSCPEELAHFIQANEVSSRQLKVEAANGVGVGVDDGAGAAGRGQGDDKDNKKIE